MTVNAKHKMLILELLTHLSELDKDRAGEIIACLDGLGYTPQRLKTRDFVLAFKSNAVRQTIAKIGIRNGEAFFGIKFYACVNPPEKFTQAVRDAVIRTKGQYACCDCGACGAAEGERGYRVVLTDGTEFVRCGAYIVEISAMTEADVSDFCTLLREQHAYFIKRT